MSADYVHLAIFVLVGVLATLGEYGAPARAAVADDRRLLTNFGLGILAMLSGLLPWISPVAAAALVAERGWGVAGGPLLAAVPQSLQSGIAVIAFSLVSYGLHRLMHASDFLWRWHAVHHSDRQLDFSTGFRAHPCEAILASVSLALTSAVLGLDPWAVAAALIVLQALDLASHSNIRVPRRAERLLGQLFATPAIHARHHSANRSEHDSNFGNALIVWDRVFGTYSGACPPQRIGLN
jgi:sterol desaturase/sphingolipid hydroxylase (fatty acid hydroxylase superfamily)